MDMVRIDMKMENYIQESLKIIDLMDKENIFGIMEISIKVFLLIIKDMAMVC